MVKSETKTGEIRLINNIHPKAQEEHEGQHQGKQNPVKQREWNVRATSFALNTVNPIRDIVDNLNVQPNKDKSFIPLSVGESNMIFFGKFLYDIVVDDGDVDIRMAFDQSSGIAAISKHVFGTYSWISRRNNAIFLLW